jgi:hypothetical protein
MRPIHRADLRQDDSPPFWGKEWFIRGCNEAAALRMVLSASASLALGAANAEAKSVGGRWLAQVIRCQDGEQRSEQIDSLRWPPRPCQSSHIQSPLASDAMQSAAFVASRWSAESGLHACARRGRMPENASRSRPTMCVAASKTVVPADAHMRVDLKLPLNSHALPSFPRLVSHPAGRPSAPC